MPGASCGIVFHVTRSVNTCEITSIRRMSVSTIWSTPSFTTCGKRSAASANVWESDAIRLRLRPPPLRTRATAMAAMAGAAVIALMLFPSTAHAWTPGTHVFLGEAIMRSPQLLPPAIAELLRAFPYDFLYGSIAADTSIAKKYAPVGRHCHSWAVGLEILDLAADEPLRAFALGYLAHLA